MMDQALPTGLAASPGSAVHDWTSPGAAPLPPDALSRLHRLAARLASHPEALELLSDIDAVAREVADHRAATERLSLMTRVSEALAWPGDIDTALDRVAAMLVGPLADACIVYAVDEHGRARVVACRHVDGSRQALLEEGARQFAPGSGRCRGASAMALETGGVVFLPDMAPELFQRAIAPRGLARLRPLAPCSAMALPLRARGRTLGVLSLQMSSSRRHHGVVELEQARELAERIAVAADSASLLRDAEESRALLDTLFRSTPVGLALLDRDLRYLRVNEAMGALLAAPAATVLGRQARDADAPFGAFVAEAGPRLMSGREPLVVTEVAGAAPDGRPAHWLVTLYPVRTPAGKCLGVGAAVLDITERKQAELEGEAAREAAEAASLAKSQFLAVISHELRTPLTTVIGYADMLIESGSDVLGGREREQLRRIKKSAWLLVSIIEEILTFSRADAGKEHADLQPVDVVELAREAVDAVEPLAQARGLVFRARGLEGVRRVITDGGKIRQVLLNLLGNAVKFTEQGAVELELVDGADVVEFRVRDTGPGIASGDLKAVFEPFRQLDQSNTRRNGGTGLGLTVSRQLARLLGGDIAIDSRLGVGSVFTLTVPARRPQSAGSSWTSATPSGV